MRCEMKCDIRCEIGYEMNMICEYYANWKIGEMKCEMYGEKKWEMRSDGK